MMVSSIVIELEIVKKNGVWYVKGLDWNGDECWEVVEEGYYGDDDEL